MSDTLRNMERDIEETRARLDMTIERLQDRLTPASMLDEAVGYVRESQLRDVSDNLLVAIRQNPVAVALIAAGVGWLLYGSAARAGRSYPYRRRSAAGVPYGRPGVRPVMRTSREDVYRTERAAAPADASTLDETVVRRPATADRTTSGLGSTTAPVTPPTSTIR